MTFNLSTLQAGLEALSGIDIKGAMSALESSSLSGDLTAAEDVLAVVAVFFPEAQYLKDALVVVGMIVQGYEAGTISSSSVESPAMQRVTGSNH